MRAVCTQLNGTAEELDGVNFDVIVVRLPLELSQFCLNDCLQCASAYHHFESIEAVTRTLTFFLKPGGTLMVSDIMKPSDGEVFPRDGAHRHIVAHRGGFEEKDLQKAFDAADLRDTSFNKVTSAKTPDGRQVDIFLATGLKSL